MVVGASENVQVVVRVRPLTGKERERGEDELVACVGDRTLQVQNYSAFTFSVSWMR